jgi:hypothetical protein
MKKIFFILLFATSFGLISCGGEEDCRTCSLNFAAIENSTEICPDGDGIKVTNTTAGLSMTETISDVSVSEYVNILTADDSFSCN